MSRNLSFQEKAGAEELNSQREERWIKGGYKGNSSWLKRGRGTSCGATQSDPRKKEMVLHAGSDDSEGENMRKSD